MAYDVLRKWIEKQPIEKNLDTEILSLLLELVGRVLEPPVAQTIGNWCLDHLGQLAGNDQGGQAGIAIYRGRMGDTEEAMRWFNKARETLSKQ